MKLSTKEINFFGKSEIFPKNLWTMGVKVAIILMFATVAQLVEQLIRNQ